MKTTTAGYTKNLVDVAGFDVSCIDWNEAGMLTALLEGLLGGSGIREVVDKLTAFEAATPPPDQADRQDAHTSAELREKARQAGRGEPISLRGAIDVVDLRDL